MTEQQEIIFFKQAKKIIRAGYGKPCPEFAFGCAGCEANLAVAWIDKHISLMEWSKKRGIKS